MSHLCLFVLDSQIILLHIGREDSKEYVCVLEFMSALTELSRQQKLRNDVNMSEYMFPPASVSSQRYRT